MFKTTLSVEGMSCGMCEAHVNDAVRKAFPSAKKVTSSRMKKLTEVISETEPDTDALRRAAMQEGMHTIRENARSLVLDGTTSLSEMQRISMEDDFGEADDILGGMP